MGNVVSFFDGREIRFEDLIVLDNFGAVIGMSFGETRGRVDVAMTSPEICRILGELREQLASGSENSEIVTALEVLLDHYMEESVFLVAKCVIGTHHVAVHPDPPRE